MNREIVLIAHNVRSANNVGSLLRTCDGLGVKKVYLTGYTPYPSHESDVRLPHITRRVEGQIKKTSLGAEKTVKWEQLEEINTVLDSLKKSDYRIVGLEQTKNSKPLNSYGTPQKIAVIVGREVEGIEPEVLKKCDDVLEIPMYGQKESFNVSVAAAIALAYFRFTEI